MNQNDYNGYFPTWCPGCGNYGIWAALKGALVKLGLKPDQFVLVYGVGCSGNMNDFVKVYGFHSLHGRAVPNAVGIKLANHKMPVIVVGGDGDQYGEGGNHFMHACRGNYDITVLVHNNQVYGLTTGQVSPTSNKGTKSKSTPGGIIEEPINPLALAVSQGASYVAQGFSGDIPLLTDLIVNAVNHKGFSLVNCYQPCVTFNKVNTYQWFRERVYKLDESHNKTDRKAAINVSIDNEKIPLGVVYQVEKLSYEDGLPQLASSALVDAQIATDITPLLVEMA